MGLDCSLPLNTVTRSIFLSGQELASGPEFYFITARMPDDLLDASLVLSLVNEISPALAIRRPKQCLAFIRVQSKCVARPHRNRVLLYSTQSSLNYAQRLSVRDLHRDEIPDIRDIWILWTSRILWLAASVPSSPQHIR